MIESSQGHINLFEGLEKVGNASDLPFVQRCSQALQQEMITSTKGKKPVNETDKGVPLAPLEKDLKPWYSEKGKGRMVDDMDSDRRYVFELEVGSPRPGYSTSHTKPTQKWRNET